MSASVDGPVARTYFGWQPEKVNFLFGLSARRALMLAGAVLAGVWPLAASRLALGVVCWPVALLLTLLVYARVAGRTVDEWAVAFVSFHLNRARGRHLFLAAAFTPDYVEPQGPKSMDLPGVLAPLRILQARMPGVGPLAVAYHRHERTYTAVARVRFPGIGLVDSGRRDQRVAGWGALLAGLCTQGNPIAGAGDATAGARVRGGVTPLARRSSVR